MHCVSHVVLIFFVAILGLCFHVTQQTVKKIFENDEFDWPFLFGDCIIAKHVSIKPLLHNQIVLTNFICLMFFDRVN